MKDSVIIDIIIREPTPASRLAAAHTRDLVIGASRAIRSTLITRPRAISRALADRRREERDASRAAILAGLHAANAEELAKAPCRDEGSQRRVRKLLAAVMLTAFHEMINVSISLSFYAHCVDIIHRLHRLIAAGSGKKTRRIGTSCLPASAALKMPALIRPRKIARGFDGSTTRDNITPASFKYESKMTPIAP